MKSQVAADCSADWHVLKNLWRPQDQEDTALLDPVSMQQYSIERLIFAASEEILAGLAPIVSERNPRRNN